MKQELIPCLKGNQSLTNLDLRFNPGYSIKIKQIVALCLLKNIDKIKRSREIHIKKKWLNPYVLLMDIMTEANTGG